MWGVIIPVLLGLLICSTDLFIHLRSPSGPVVVFADNSSVVPDLPARVAALTRQQGGIMLMSASGILMLLMSLGRIYVHSRYRRAESSDA